MALKEICENAMDGLEYSEFEIRLSDQHQPQNKF